MVFGFGKTEKKPNASNNTRKLKLDGMKAKYKMFKTVKNYTPMPVGKRGFMGKAEDKHLNTIWALNTENPLQPATIKEARDRYTKLLSEVKKGKKNDARMTELLTLYKLLKNKSQINGLEYSGTNQNANIYTNAYLARPGASVPAVSPESSQTFESLNSSQAASEYIAEHDTIGNTIKRMKCTVCQSQSIIDKGLGETVRTCDICGAATVPAPVPANVPSPNATNNNIGNVSDLHNYLNELPVTSNVPVNVPRPKGPKPNELGNNPLSAINTTLTSNTNANNAVSNNNLNKGKPFPPRRNVAAALNEARNNANPIIKATRNLNNATKKVNNAQAEYNKSKRKAAIGFRLSGLKEKQAAAKAALNALKTRRNTRTSRR
jgi:hypothetical protein